MDVADNRHGGLNVDDIALAHEQLLCLGAYRFNDRFGQELFLIQARDALVQIDRGCPRALLDPAAAGAGRGVVGGLLTR